MTCERKGLYEKYPYFLWRMLFDMLLYADTMAGDDTTDNGKLTRKVMADIIGNENWHCVVKSRQMRNNASRHREDVISYFARKQRKRAELYRKEAQCQYRP